MRRALDTLYDAAGYLAALFLAGTLAMVLTGIAGRLLNFHVPGTDSYAGYCMTYWNSPDTSTERRSDSEAIERYLPYRC